MFIFLFALFLGPLEAASSFNCKATFDQMNIPHQEVKSEEEYYYCFGYHHGRDRAWEMDYLRRVGEGRNAEVLGFSQLKSDLMMRLLDLPGVAEKIWKDFSPEKKKWLELYSDGVNEGFKRGKKVKEFKDSEFKPESWHPQDSLLVLLLQSFDQTRKTFFRDYEEERNKAIWGKEANQIFDEDQIPWESTILKEGEYKKAQSVKTSYSEKRSSLKLWAQFPTPFGEESGSNNWAVSGKKSKSGHAILANDPHLDLKTPLFWYWMQIKSPEFNVLGASVPGVPVMASGTNGKVSWGLTNSYLNAADVFFMKDIKSLDVVNFRPTVYVKLWFFKVPFFFKSFEHLKTGHRILPLEIEKKDRIALRWSGFSLGAADLYPMFDFYKTKNVTEMDQVLKTIGIPSWNFVFADTKGEIGYRLVGKTYRHTSKNPYGMVTKTLEELANEEFLSNDEKPGVLNPKRNFVATANNRHWPKDSEFYGGRGYSYSFRSLRIEELLGGVQDRESFKRIQCDREAVDARFFLPKLQKSFPIPELAQWSRIASDESKELPLYRRIMDLLLEKWQVNEYALYKLLDNLSPAQTSELKEIYQLARKEVNGRSWGEIQVVNFPHMSKNNNWSFAEEIPGVGDTHSVDPGTSRWNSKREVYEQYSGASMRMIIEMSDPVKVELILPGLNRNYQEKSEHSPWRSWKSCEYENIPYHQ